MAEHANITTRSRVKRSGTDKSRASPAPNPTHGRPVCDAVQKDTPSRDAWLISLCDEFLAIEEERSRLRKAAEGAAHERLCERTADRSRELLSTIFATPATTPQSLGAKANIARKLVSRDGKGEPFERDRPLNSLVSDILAQAAKPQGPDGELLEAFVRWLPLERERVAVDRLYATKTEAWDPELDHRFNAYTDAWHYAAEINTSMKRSAKRRLARWSS